MARRHLRRALAGCIAVLAVALPLGVTVAASSPSEPGETRTVETFYGPVEVPTTPKRIVAVSYDTPWQLAGIGVEPVGVQDYSAWRDQFSDEEWAVVDGIDTVGSFDDLNFEAIAALDPDLIIGDAYEIDEATLEKLADVAPTAIAGGDARGDWRAIVDGYGEFTGAADAADATRQAYEDALDRVTTEYADQLEGAHWGYVTIGDSDGQFSLLYPNSAWGELLYDGLGVSLPEGVEDSQPDSGYESYSFEQAGEYLGGAEILLYPIGGDGSMYPWMDAMLTNPVVSGVPAIAEDMAFGIATSISDYVSAEAWLAEVETTVLEPLEP